MVAIEIVVAGVVVGGLAARVALPRRAHRPTEVTYICTFVSCLYNFLSHFNEIVSLLFPQKSQPTVVV